VTGPYLCILPIIARSRLGKDVPAATNTHATIELLEGVVSVRSVSCERKVGD
jgi:hypothetical protein